MARLPEARLRIQLTREDINHAVRDMVRRRFPGLSRSELVAIHVVYDQRAHDPMTLEKRTTAVANRMDSVEPEKLADEAVIIVDISLVEPDDSHDPNASNPARRFRLDSSEDRDD